MSFMRSNQKGFAVLESLLVLVILVSLVGVGAYVWHAQKQTASTLNAAAKVAQSSPQKVTKKTKAPTQPTGTQKYLTIKEWGVRAPYTGSDVLSYRITDAKDNSVEVVSQDLAKTYGCTDFGAGIIARGVGTDAYFDTTYAAAYQQTPTNFTKSGQYYYTYAHDQAACSNTVTTDAENAANLFTKSLIPHLQPSE